MEPVSKSKPIWPIVIIGFVLIFLFAVAVKLLVLANPPVGPDDAARAVERTKAHEDLMAENAKKLTTFAWVDKTKGHVQIPIDQAIDLTIAEINSRPPAAAGPIVPATAPAAAPAAQPSADPAVQPAPAN